MKVVLTQQVKKVGEKNDVCEVKAGYAKNFLIPNKMALIATDANILELKKITKKAKIESKGLKTKKRAKKKSKK